MAKSLIGKFEHKEEEEEIVIFRGCHFFDSNCRYDRDRANRSSKPRGATIRINDSWICNWHYEHGYDRSLRQGEVFPKHEQKIQSRLFGGKFDEEADAEREAIQSEGA